MSTYNRHADSGSGSAGGATSNNVLWMGDVDVSMDEPFLMQVFAELTEPAEYVRVMRPKDGKSAPGYAFVGFGDEATAQRVLNNWNGKPIPNLEGKRFKLNSSTRNRPPDLQLWNRQNGPRLRPPEFTAYIGDMTTDMDDVSFYDLFKGSYPSVFAARIMRMPDGTSKHFAFVRFHDEAEYSQALSHENQISMQLGCRIRICKAHPRPPRRFPATGRFEADQQLADLSAKFQNNMELQQQQVHQSSPSGHQLLPQSAQSFPAEATPAVYFIPAAGYPPAFLDPAYWNSQWQERYPVPEVTAQPAFTPAVGLPEAGDASNMQPYHPFVRSAGWQMHLPQPYFLPDQRFVYATGDVVDAADGAKRSSSKTDQFHD